MIALSIFVEERVEIPATSSGQGRKLFGSHGNGWKKIPPGPFSSSFISTTCTPPILYRPGCVARRVRGMMRHLATWTKFWGTSGSISPSEIS